MDPTNCWTSTTDNKVTPRAIYPGRGRRFKFRKKKEWEDPQKPPPPRQDAVEKHSEDSALEHANHHHTNKLEEEWDARDHYPTAPHRHFHDSWLGLVENALRLADLCPPELPSRQRRQDSDWNRRHTQSSPQPQPQDDVPRSSPTTSCSCPTLHQPDHFHDDKEDDGNKTRLSSHSIHVQATYSSRQSRHGSRVPQNHAENDQNETDEKGAAPNGSRHRPWPGLQQALDHVARIRRHSHEVATQPQPEQHKPTTRSTHSTANGTHSGTTVCCSCIHVWLHEGIYELTRPLVLHGPWHSHVTIQAMPGHSAWIVGSRRVVTTAKAITTKPTRKRTAQSPQLARRGHTNSRRNSSSSTGKLPQKQQQTQRPTTRNKKRESNTIYALDLRDWWLEWNRKTHSQSASSASETRMGGGDNDLQQQSRDDDPKDTNKKNDDHSSVHDVDVPKLVSLFAGHHDNDESIRYVRARWPNANPELDQWGYASPHKLQYSIDSAAVVEWHRPPPGRPPQFTWINFDTPSNNSSSVPRKNNSAMSGYNGYASGVGGVCVDMWGPFPSYWCSNHSQGGWAEVDQECAQTGHLQLPLSMTYNLTALQERPDYPHHYPHDDRNHQHGPNWTGGIVHAWHSQTWSMHMFEITHQDHGLDPAPNGPTTGRLQFAPGGGRQGGRNWCRCDQCTYAASWCGQHDATQPWKDTRLISGTWMVENVLDELDQPGEYFLDRQDLILYVIPNKTRITDSHDDENNDTTNKNDHSTDSNQDTNDTHTVNNDEWVQDFRLGWLERLLDLRDGVEDVTIQNLGFRETASTYLAPDWSAPSGGDWSLHRNGAIFLQNVSNITIRHCRFEKLDGTAIFLSQKTRHVTIEHNSFGWLGENAIATWGETKDYDGTEENFPMYTVIQHNLMRELGIYQKQSSAVGQCKAAMTTIRNNIMFNMPRAAINFNDMLGGGDIVEGNLIFNTCRESGDHGPSNTWDRQPFLTTLRYGTDTPSFDPIPRIIRHNLIFANYGASQGVDNDDGSSWYHIYRNVFYDAKGFKMDYGGHDSVFEDNLVLSYGLNHSDCFEVANFLPGHGHAMRRNKCLVGLQGDSHPYHQGCGDPMCSEHSSMFRPPLLLSQSPRRRMKQQHNDSPKSRSRSRKSHHHSSWRNASAALVIVGTMYSACENSSFGLSSNQYYTPTGSAAIQCNGQLFDLETVQRHFSLEQGSTVQALPTNTTSTIVEWVWETLIDDKSRRN